MIAERLSAAVARTVAELLRPLRRRPGGRRVPLPRYLVDPLEPRQLLSAALDLIGVNALRADPAFSDIDGSGGTVVVIDTGVDFSHPKLSGAKVTEGDFVYGSGEGTERITDEHGTHVAGIIGARDSNIGVATGVGLIGLQVFTETASGDVSSYETDIEQALAWTLAHRQQYNIVAVNLSLGSGNYTSESAASSSIIYDDVKRLEAAGVTVVTAAGNSYASYKKAGSASPGVFSTLDVGAVYETNEGRVGGGDGTDYTTAADRIAYFSQRPNTDNEVFAPGAFITSTVPGGGTKDLAGTSMASPMVAGVVALMQEAAQKYGGRLLTPAEVRTIIQQTGDVVVDGDDEDTSVPTTGRSYLRVNAYNAVKAIRDQFAGTNPGGGGTSGTDPNGTIAGAVAGPTLGLAANPDALDGTIGADGSTDVGAKDVDLYRVVVSAPGDVTVTVATSQFQSVLRVFNSVGLQLGSFTAAGSADNVQTVSLAAGTYYFGVSGAGNAAYSATSAGSGTDGATGDYSIDFSLDTADADGVLTGATALNLSAGDAPQSVSAAVGTDGAKQVGGGDVDFYRVVVPDDGTLLVDIDTPDTDTYADTYVRVFDESGNQLAFSDDDLATGLSGEQVEFRTGGFGSTTVVDADGNFAGHRTDSFVGGGVSRGDVYYIAVANYNNRNFQPSTFAGRVTTGSTGAYSLSVGFRNNDVNGAIPQAVQTATLPVEQAPGVIGTDNSTVDVGDRDVDFIRLRPTSAGILDVKIDSYDDATITDKLDAVARLFDADGKLLATVDDVAGSLDPRLRFRVSADTDYYLAVSGKGNDTFDPFLLGSGGSGDTGEYTFSAQVLPESAEAGLTNDTAGGAVADLALGTPVTASVGDDDGFAVGKADVDLYAFTAPFGGTFTFTAEPSDAFGADPYLRVFDAAGTELAHDDNGGTTTNGNTGGARIQIDLTAGQKYLIGVNGAGPNAGAYNPITGAGAADSDNTGGYVLEATTDTRTLTFGGKTKATYTDA
ncbi:MAG TPA: S8 family serine peptidase, partial [Humisphaera sp.]